MSALGQTVTRPRLASRVRGRTGEEAWARPALAALLVATADGPDVVCLQEVPVWALHRIDDWSGMRRFEAVTRPPLWPGPLSKWVTRAHQGFFRSGLAGQANAILVAPRHATTDLGHERISEQGRERRFVHAVRIAGTAGVTIANLHASNDRVHPEVPRVHAGGWDQRPVRHADLDAHRRADRERQRLRGAVRDGRRDVPLDAEQARCLLLLVDPDRALELAVEPRRSGYGQNGERLGFDLYPYTEDAVAAVTRSVLQWRFIDGVAARIDDAALREAQQAKDAVRAYELVYAALGA